eukprot:2450263-Lingulodinium_polyedra.AAC.1
MDHGKARVGSGRPLRGQRICGRRPARPTHCSRGCTLGSATTVALSLLAPWSTSLLCWQTSHP